jgi:hypothetical protein
MKIDSSPGARPPASLPVSTAFRIPRLDLEPLPEADKNPVRRTPAPFVAQPLVQRRLDSSRPTTPAPARAGSSATWGSAAQRSQGVDLGTDPEVSPTQVALTFENHFEQMDTAGGGKRDGIFNGRSLEAVAADPNADPSLRAAAQQALDEANLFHALDVADGEKLDGKVSLSDLQAQQEFSPLSDKAPRFVDVARDLSRNFSAFDSAQNGKEDGLISQGDLRKIAQDPSQDPKQRELAQMLLDDPTYWNAFDVAAKKGEKDGLVSRDDVSDAASAAQVENLAQDLWTSESEDALERVLNDPTLGEADIFEGFGQTDRGNCASTAVIKAAMDRFGNEIFDEVKTNASGGYDVTMQDGTQVSLNREEMEAAAAGTQYKGENREMKSYATLAYAAMAKRAQNEGHEDSRTFGEALVSLANGENVLKSASLIGLEDRVQKISLDDIRGQDGVVASGDGHAFYVDTQAGKTYGDRWGTRTDYDGSNFVTSEQVDGTQKVGRIRRAFIFD